MLPRMALSTTRMDTSPHIEEELAPDARTSSPEPPEAVVVMMPRRERRLLFWFVCPVCMIALTLGALFIARSHHIVGPMVKQAIEREAAARNIDIYIKSMRPKGLFDVRFEEVRVRHRRGAYVLDTNMAYLDVSPDLFKSIVAGRPIPRQISMEGAHILLERSTPGPGEIVPGKSGAASLEPGRGTQGMDTIELVGKDVTIALKAGSFATTKELELTRINASIPLSGAPLPSSLSAYGTLPDGVQFALSTSPRAGDLPGNIITLKPQSPTRIDQWFEGQLPFTMVATGLELCSGCEQDRVALGAVDIELPNFGKGLSVSAPDAELLWAESKGFLNLEDVAITGMRSELDLELERLQMSFEPESGIQRGELSVVEGLKGSQKGQLQLEWQWENDERALTAKLDADRFSLRPLLVLLDVDPILHRGKVSGDASFMVDWRAALIETQTQLTFEDAAASLPFFSSEPIATPLLIIDSDVLIDLRGRALSLNHLELTFKDVKPVRLKAHVVDADQGWRFDVAAIGRDIEAASLLRALPEIITKPIKGAKLEGHFGFDFSARGHSAYPESLELSIDVDGDVMVLEDGPWADIMALKEPGYPIKQKGSALNLPITSDRWVDLASLPLHVPRGLLAAEDAAFYRHNGFDFGGLARAMIHNLKVRRMERGGSTITQQLVKNLFLSRERTAMRKLQEAYLTWRIEHELGKRRILEIYLNLVHWGKDIYGVRAAALHYFDREPHNLGVDQMSLLGTILPNPERFGGHIKQGFIASSRIEKLEHVLANLRFLGHIALDDYYFWMNRARRGSVGGLKLTVCRDDDTVPEETPACPRIE